MTRDSRLATKPLSGWRIVLFRNDRIGDLVLWDNRAVLHRGCRYDLAEVRDMRRTTVLDPVSVQERDCGDDG